MLELDAATRHYTATVPGLPIVVDATSKRAAVGLAREAISLYLEETKALDLPVVRAEVVNVKV